MANIVKIVPKTITPAVVKVAGLVGPTGTFASTTAPTNSYGKAGDTLGMIAFDSSYFYYCTANYVNNSTNIWKRIALPSTTW